MLRYSIALVVVFAAWVHWRAAYTVEVRAALDDLAANQQVLEDLIEDVRDKRLAYRLKAVVADHRAGDTALCREHIGDALERLDHLERFAPLRRALARRPDA